jgi:hypothetical protein
LLCKLEATAAKGLKREIYDSNHIQYDAASLWS